MAEVMRRPAARNLPHFFHRANESVKFLRGQAGRAAPPRFSAPRTGSRSTEKAAPACAAGGNWSFQCRNHPLQKQLHPGRSGDSREPKIDAPSDQTTPVQQHFVQHLPALRGLVPSPGQGGPARTPLRRFQPPA